MTVVLRSKNSFQVVQLDAVSSITYSSGTYTIVHGGGTATVTDADYIIQIV